MVRLIQYQMTILWQDVIIRYRIRQQQSMIDNQYVRRFSRFSRLIKGAFTGHRGAAAIKGAALIFRAHPLPGVIFNWPSQRDLAFIATAAFQKTHQNFGKCSQFINMSRASPPR